MSSTLSKQFAIRLFGSQAKLAKALDISRAAVAQWPDDEPIPEKQAMRIRYELKPEAFKRNGHAR